MRFFYQLAREWILGRLKKQQLKKEKKEAAGDDISKKPAFDMKLEALIPVIKGEIPLKAHAHATEDILPRFVLPGNLG